MVSTAKMQSRKPYTRITGWKLKLSAQAADLPALERALFEMTSGSGRVPERLITTYHDTRELALERQGLTLRIREQGGRFIQTVRAVDLAAAEMLLRCEWEDEIADGRPKLRAPISGAHLPDCIAGDLGPLFLVDVIRTTFEIEPNPGTRIEAAIDRGEVRMIGAEAAEPVGEIELKLMAGDAAALCDIALRLLKIAPFRIETRDDSERGYRLVDGTKVNPPVFHARPVNLDPNMTVGAALREIGGACLAQLQRNEAAVLSAATEGVHQMRIAIRRMRSAVSSFKKKFPAKERRWIADDLGWLSGALGRARNLDVFATELLPIARAALPDGVGWDELAATLDRLRRAEYDQVREAILSERYTGAMLRLLRCFATCDRHDYLESGATRPSSLIGKAALRVLDRRRRKLQWRGKGFGRLTPRQRHELRIAVKQLRYTIELCANLFDENDRRRFVADLKRLQDDLGYANDIRAAHDLTIGLFARIDSQRPAADAWIALLAWHDQVLANREAEPREQLRRLNRTAPFWHKVRNIIK
jgi:inorganic triphosphatase YgiF